MNRGTSRGTAQKIKNNGGNVCGREFVIGSKDAIQDPSVVSGTLLINNVYTIVLFNYDADRIFATLTFKQLLNHDSSKLDVAYEVEVANGQIKRTIEILNNCTITLND